jgi:GDP-L-fucose synthase
MKYYIAGNRGLVGKNYNEYIDTNVGGNTDTIDYTDKSHTISEIQREQPSHVVINAATVGGLQEDLDRSFELMLRNLNIQNNLFEACAISDVDRVLLQGSTCSYPQYGEQPFKEEHLLDGKPFDGYLTTALPKLVGMYQCRASNDKRGTKWRTAICTNMFGPGDRTGEHAHVVGALMQKFVTAVREDHSEIEIWGSGNQSRDLLYIKDAVCAMDLTLNNDTFDTVNIASGVETTIRELAETLKRISGFRGKLFYNTDRPEGIGKRAISNERLRALGWEPEYKLEEALTETYEWYNDNI